MTRALVLAGLIGVTLAAAGATAAAQGTVADAPARPVAKLGPLELPVGVITAPREDAARLPFPASLLQREGQFGIDRRAIALPLTVLGLMVVVGIVTFRVAFRR